MAGRLIGISGMIVVLGALALAPAAQAGDSQFQVRVAKGDKHGEYRNALRQNIRQGDTKSIWWRVKNKDNEELALTFTDDDSANQEDAKGYGIRWYKHGTNVTNELTGPGYEFHLDPGQSKYFNAQVKKNQPGNADFCLEGEAYDVSTTKGAYAGINVDCVP